VATYTYQDNPDVVDLPDPAIPPIPRLMAIAIRSAFCPAKESCVEGEEIVFNLPPGTPAEVYQRVIGHLGAARPIRRSWERAVHVMEVRAGAVESEVEVIVGSPGIAVYGTGVAYTVSILYGQRVVLRIGRTNVTPPAPHCPEC
jgi:hypothetical protein